MDYIKRADALHSVCVGCNKEFEEKPCEPSFCDIRRAIQNVPTADVAEVKHGKWKPIVKQDNYLDPPYWESCKCSVCEYEIDVSETFYNYCPNCGAKMDGKEDA